ncbi:hypothetical protein B0H10DRAFT_2434321 [Mycena sp. CBHHK59/15]|nr:hypothetical protein B0H10DRAFT_2434321 [Mycena sp. CBHHK59/15]
MGTLMAKKTIDISFDTRLVSSPSAAPTRSRCSRASRSCSTRTASSTAVHINPAHILCNMRDEIRLCGLGAAQELIGPAAAAVHEPRTPPTRAIRCLRGRVVPRHRPARARAQRRFSVPRRDPSPADGLTEHALLQHMQSDAQAAAFVTRCLVKDPGARGTPRAMLDDPWIAQGVVTDFWDQIP